jgi:hypothetical protein
LARTKRGISELTAPAASAEAKVRRVNMATPPK